MDLQPTGDLYRPFVCVANAHAYCSRASEQPSAASLMSSEESTSSESESEEEAIDGEDKRKRGAPEGAPRIASGPLMEGEDDEELRCSSEPSCREHAAVL